MVNYGKVRGSIKPEAIRIDDYSVWECSNIQEITEPDPETGLEKTEYEYDMVKYSKDEFILLQMEQITNTELALCEVYELLV